ncbi:hypothetical protein [Pimelobacter simplex]|uniref:hypothetical protein n=1 Tax=Nocardioides simplex TaxID=2045 RepID=UPI002150662A|nr:hypothetical protein [Pimelobacter simplex]UUW91124.1 hypothetical protein M0M43_06475 [Pimelobacter simplex]UUW94952.1 hypothetical protein M0M48_24980 [Pimelobacter simplex]
MPFFRHLTRSAVALAAALTAILAVLMATTVPAQAFTTYTPTGGPDVRFVGTGVTLEHLPTGEVFSCPTFDLAGTVISSGTSRSYGAPAAGFSTTTSSCRPNVACGPVSLAILVPGGFAITGDTSSGTWPARIAGVKLRVSCSGCQLTLDGSVDGRFNATTGVFTPNAGPSGLLQTSTNGDPLCVIMGFQNGDAFAVGGHWTNVPPSGSVGLAVSNP